MVFIFFENNGLKMPIELDDGSEIRIGDWELLPKRNLLRSAGQELHLEPRHADLLLFLATHRGEVFSADQIIEEVWQGQVVTDQSVYQAIAKLRKAMGDEASNPSYIETVPKRGYRLIANVAVAAGTSDPPRPGARADDARSGVGSTVLRRALGIGLLTAALMVFFWAVLRPAPTGAPKGPDTVAVLPFSVLSENPDDQLIAEGFAIELAHALGRSGKVRVIGPVSSALATRLESDLGEIGRHVNAGIVVSGSLRRASNTLTVSGKLTEVPSGLQLWSAVFDRNDTDVLAIQREVASAITTALKHTVQDEPGIPSPVAQPVKVGAYDNYLLGRYYRNRRTENDLQRARQYFAEALRLDPDYVPAIREMATAELLLSFYGSVPLSAALENADPFLERSALLAPQAAEVLATIGLSHYLQGSYGLAEDFLMRAVAVHPNLAEAWMWLGLARQQQGRLHDALTALEYASELEPLLVTAVVNYANALNWQGKGADARRLLTDLAGKANASLDNRDQLFRVLSSILRESGELAEAYAWTERALEAAPDSALSKANKVFMLALLGETDAASRLATELFSKAVPGRGTLGFLMRTNVSSPGVLDSDLLNANLEALQRQPDTPEIEWRLSNLDVGMAAYFDNDTQRAATLLGKALRGRNYPVSRADDDLFACGSLVDALARSGRSPEAADQLSKCNENRDNAEHDGWDSLSMTVSSIRLAVLGGNLARARRQLAQLFDMGLRNEPILVNDPVLNRLGDTGEYRTLLTHVRQSVTDARRSIGFAAPSRGLSAGPPATAD